MMMQKKILAIITARGGSKRIPRKNIKNFLGSPIIQYSIDAAIQSGIFNPIMVSTDDKEIADIARSCGADVPFFRSAETSTDLAGTADVIKEVLMKYKMLGKEFEYACCLYPTAPFITPEKLKKAFELLQNSDADSVLPVTEFSYPISRSLKIENKFVKMNWPEYMNTRSQDLPPAYHDCGQFYFFKTDPFLKTNKILTEKTIPLIFPSIEVQDIDNETDWKIAEIKYQYNKSNRNN